MGLISGFILFSLIVTFGYLLGILTFITDHEINECEMTYMYEYPQFVRIRHNADNQYQKYGLYAYSEGRFTYNTRNMKFNGIPVLFIPGNAGSYRQVRSFASVALRKSLYKRPGFHFDFFSVDLNDEFSGLNGALLNEQTEYVNNSITRILELYNVNNKGQRKSIILIGHSMGGIIARGILTALEDNSVIPLIITLATPHSRSPLLLDSYMHDYYDKIRNSNGNMYNTVISISGGYNDFMISPFITVPKNFDSLHVFSSSIPIVWLPIDHLCILWCKQLVLVVTRGLFDAVDFNTKDISKDPKYLEAVFHHYLVNNNGIKIRKSIQSFHSTHSMTFGRGRGEWIENLQKQYTILLQNGVQQVQYHMIRILNDADYRYLTILALNLEVVEWAFACSATQLQGQHRICSEGIHLSHISEIAPSVRYKRRILKLDTQELKNNYTDVTHVILRILPTNEPVTIHIDRYWEPNRKLEFMLPSVWSLQREFILNETEEKVMHYEIALPQLQHVIQSYQFYLEPIKCNKNIHHATVSLIVPWGNQNSHDFLTKTKRNPFLVRLHTSRPNSLNYSASIILTLDPACRYSLSVRNNILGTIGQITRFYTPLLLPNMVAVLLLTFRNQILEIEATGSCCLFFNAIQHGIKPYYILPFIKLASRGLSWKGFSNFLPMPDWQIITEEGNDFLLLPLILYMTSVGFVWLAALGLAISLIFCESTFHKLACKVLARTMTGSLKFSDWLISGFHKLPGIVAITLIILSVTTCGGLSLCIGCVFYFLKLTQMSQDYVEQLVLRLLKHFAKKFKRNAPPQVEVREDDTVTNQDEDNSRVETEEEKSEVNDSIEKCMEGKVEEIVDGEDSDHEDDDNDNGEVAENNNTQIQETVQTVEKSDSSGIFFHFSIFMLWCIAAGLSIPSVLTWAHNFKYNSMLRPDPSFVPGLVMSVCALPLWHMDLPKTNVYGYSHVGQLLNIMTGICLIYASVFLNRLNYIITSAIALITIHQILARNYEPETEDTVTEESAPETAYGDVKTKWE